MGEVEGRMSREKYAGADRLRDGADLIRDRSSRVAHLSSIPLTAKENAPSAHKELVLRFVAFWHSDATLRNWSSRYQILAYSPIRDNP